MVIYNGLWKKKCCIENNKIIIDGQHTVIESIEEVEDYNLRMVVGLGFFILGFIVILLFSYKLVIDDIIGSADNSDKVLKGTVCVVGIILYLLSFISFYGMLGYKSYWKINSKMVFVEKSNDTADNLLRRIKDIISRQKT